MTRRKILPEDMIQKTNLRQHNLMIDAINDIDDRQGTVEDITAAATLAVAALRRKHDADIADLEEELAAIPSEVQSMIIDSFSAHLKNVLVDAEMLRFSADNKAIFLKKNRRDGITVDEQIPLSTRQNVGLATPEDLLAIDGLTDRVTTLEHSGITGELFYLHHDFSGITDAVRTVHFTADIRKPPTVGDSVIDNQQKSWRYVITGPTTFGWVEVPHLSIGGDLKAVKSSNADGKVYVESDNTCSVVGWNGVKNDVSSNANAITGHAGNTSNPHAVTQAQVGLSNVDNTSDADKPISTATQTALDTKADVSALALKADKTELALLIAQLFSPVNCTTVAGLYNGDTSVRATVPINAENCTNLDSMFSGCSKLKMVGYIHTPNATNMDSMFSSCTSLKTIPLLDTSKVRNMGHMFSNCTSLKTIPLLDISSVTSMGSMFEGCTSLTSVTFQCVDVRPYGNMMFNTTPIASGNGRIYVPDNLVQAYKTASGWSTYASVIYGHSDRP